MRILPGQLADALGRGELSEAARATLFTIGLLLPPAVAPGALRNPVDGAAYLLAALLVITVGGVALCYRANRAGDGRNVVERMVCLSPPLWIAAYVVYYLMIVVYSKFGSPPLGPPQNAEEFRAWAAAANRHSYFHSLAYLMCYAGFMGALIHFVRRAARAGVGR